METIHAVLLLLSAVAGVAFEEEDFFCEKNNVLLPSTIVCDGVVDCEDSSDEKAGDEESWICAPVYYLLHGTRIGDSDVTATSANFDLIDAGKNIFLATPVFKLVAYRASVYARYERERRKLRELSIPARWPTLTVKDLEPLTDYTIVVRPIYTKSGRNDDPKELRWIGKAVAIDLKTLSKEFCDLSITPVSSSEVLISWTPLEPAPIYQVTVDKEQGQENLTFYDVRTFNVSEKPGSTHSILFDNLEPRTHYVMHLEACTEQNCTNAGERRFLTPPLELPQPVVTEIESTHAGSIKLNWSFPSIDHDLYQGFRVRFCDTNASTCLLVFTKENGYEAEGLANDTTYNVDVRAQLKLANGIIKLGPPGTATVTTWTDVSVMVCSNVHDYFACSQAEPCSWHARALYAVPVLDVSHILDFYDQSGSSLLAWTTVDSSAASFKYRMIGSDSWTSCKDSTECNVIASRNSTDRHATGYMSITHGKKDGNVTIGVRGCNDHGCGKGYLVVFVWRGLASIPRPLPRLPHYDIGLVIERHMKVNFAGYPISQKYQNAHIFGTEYPTAYHFGVLYVDDRALLRWNQDVNDGFEITGHCGNDWKVHYENRIYPCTRVQSDELVTVQGLPHGGEGCEFTLETYKKSETYPTTVYPARPTNSDEHARRHRCSGFPGFCIA